jgi:hypothetical protein
MAEAVGTVHLNISADLQGLESKLKANFARMAPALGREFSDKFSSEFSKTLTPSMTSAVRGAFNKAQRSLTNIHVKVVADLDLGATQAQLDRLASENLSVKVNADLDDAKAKAELDRLGSDDKTVHVNVDVDSKKAKSALSDIGSGISGVASGFSTIGLAGVASMGTLIPVAVAATGAVLSLGAAAVGAGAAFGVAALAFSGVKTALSALDAQQSKAGEDAAKAAVAGIALANAQDQLKTATQGVADAHRAAARATEDAARRTSDAVQGVVDAQRQAGQASEEAARRVSDAQQGVQAAVVAASERMASAEQNLRGAQQDELAAQQSLTRARQDAVRQLQDMAMSSVDAKLRERQATLDLQQAEADLRKVQESRKSTALDIQQAILRRDVARQSAVEAHTAAQRAVDDNAKAQKSGVEGTDAVVSAKQRVKDTNDKVHQSEADLVKAQADGARNISKAQQALSDARRSQDLTAQQNARNVAKAQQDLADARRNEAEVARSNAEKIANAEKGVVSAQRGIQTALMATQQVGAATRNAVNEAFADLSPAAKHFALFIFGLKGQLDTLRAAAAESLLPPLEKAINILLPYLPQVRAFVTEVGRAMGDVAIKIAKSLTGPAWKGFFSIVRDQAPGAIRTLGGIFDSLGTTIAKILTAAAPFGPIILDKIKGFFDTINQKATPGKLKSIFDGVGPLLSSVWNIAKSIANVVRSIATAGSQDKKSAADTLNSLADSINKLATYIDQHPEVVDRLIQISVGMLAIKAANPVISTVGSLGNALGGVAQVLKLVSWGAVFGAISTGIEAVAAAIGIAVGPFIAIIAVIAAVGIGLYLLYTKCTWFHDAVNTVVSKIGAFFTWLWQKAIQPALQAIGKVLVWLYQNVVRPVWDQIRVAIDVAWAAIQVTWGLIQIALKILGKAFSWLYDNVIHPVWNSISSFIADKWNRYIKPIFDTVATYIDKNVKPKFQAAINGLKSVWDQISDWAKYPIFFILDTVLNNGLLKGYNWLASKFGVKPDDVSIDIPASMRPKGHATGGAISGPGTATSDSIPALLSNGEHVWTAREVQAAGGHNAMMAMRANVLRQAGAPGFAFGGGVFNWVKDKVSSGANWVGDKAKSAASWVGNVVGDIKDFVTNPLGTLQKLAASALNGLPGGKGSMLGNLLVGTVNKAVGGIGDYVKGFFSGGDGGSGPVGAAPVGGMVERWRPMVLRALAALGLSPGLVNRVLTQISTESGGNPNALQMVHDVNWPNNRARGLMQVIPPTFARWHVPGTSSNQYDPWASIMAGLNYAKHTYGPGLGFLGQGHGYDSGGWLMPGTQLVHNNTGKPEAVFSPSQWRALEANLRGGSDGGDFSKTTHIDVTTFGDPNAIATAIAAEQGRADLLEAISL